MQERAGQQHAECRRGHLAQGPTLLPKSETAIKKAETAQVTGWTADERMTETYRQGCKEPKQTKLEVKLKNKGFTLVEILIVVIILGILAAIVIPQFTEASNDARESALQSDLQTVRSQLELFKVQHLENYPNQIAGVGTDTTKFTNLLISRTNAAGDIMPATGGDPANYPFGPYLQKFPTNSFVTTKADQVELKAGAGTGDGTTGWYLDTTTGKFSANSDVSKYPTHSTF